MKPLLTFCLFTCSAVPAHALCIYRGIDNAKTTMAQEFRDSRWVVRARVVSADYHRPNYGASWTLYKLRVVHSYKGKLAPIFTFFTARNSGGFYMDGKGGSPDLGGEYLLFLTSEGWSVADYPAAKGALWVNYNCGQSMPWSELTPKQVRQIGALAAQRQIPAARF